MQDNFPVDAIVPELGRALAEHGRAILTASPGSGKTTRIPLALAGLLPHLAPPSSAVEPLPGKILVLEPRRLAARAAARYMARLLGENVGQHVGYRVRLDSKVSAMTRVEMLTEGMVTRRLLTDPELSGVSCVIFDEFHERSLQTDLALALCLECVSAFRPDLRILAMSATLETGELSHFLGDCPILEAKGRHWPVTICHARRELFIGPKTDLDTVAGKVATAVWESLQAEPGNILVFLPGQAEINRTANLLKILPDNTDCHSLYGNLSLAEQDAAIAPPSPGRRKVVLATDIAQTSLTIEGVRVVIDAGLARSPRFAPATGLSRLVTARLTQDAADQRSGRAGRLGPGVCLRLWSENEILQPQIRPEILDADLAPLYLDALVWGTEPGALPWLTPPQEAALQNASETLLALGAIRSSLNHAQNSRFAVTPYGQKLARLPLHPRLAHMVLQASALETNLSTLAACLAALVSERDPLRQNTAGENDADIRARLPLLRLPEHRSLKESAEQIHRLSGVNGVFRLPGPEEENFCGLLLSLAWPERIAQRRSAGGFRLASGQGAELPAHDPLASEPWLVAVSLGEGVNKRIRLAAPITLPDLLHTHGDAVRSEEEISWDNRSEAVVSRSIRTLGALILEEKPLPLSPNLKGHMKKALLEGITSLGLDCLPWTDDLRQLQARVSMLREWETLKDNSENVWPDMRDAALLAALLRDPEEAWLAPWVEGINRRAQFSSIDLGAALRSLLPWSLIDRLEKEAPNRVELPSGSSAIIDYLPALRGESPVLAVKLQEMFGQTDSPRLANGRIPVMLHLLSPAGRPLQVTTDLRHFWNNSYKQVRSEMRGRYPKHPWPEDPLTAEPTGKTKKRMGTPHPS